MIVGVGIDVVPVERFAASLRRTRGLTARLFTAAERMTVAGQPRTPQSLAARFAAKEAVAKALGVPAALQWHDCEVRSAPDGRPALVVAGTVASAAALRGVVAWHLSLSHDGGIASAVVVAEGAPPVPAPATSPTAVVVAEGAPPAPAPARSAPEGAS